MAVHTMKTAALCLLCVALTGCNTIRRAFEVRVPYAVPCQQKVPARPVMPTEGLKPGTNLFVFTRAAQAEIERREGYEGELLTALVACTAEQVVTKQTLTP